MHFLKPTAFVLLSALVGLLLTACGSAKTASRTSSSTPIPSPLSTIKPAPTPVIIGAEAAIVNGHNVPISAFRTYLTLVLRSTEGPSGHATSATIDQAMTQAIDDQLIADFASAHGIAVSKGDIDKQEARDIAQSGGQKAFNGRVTDAGLTVAEYRSLVYHNLLAQKLEQYLFPVRPKPQPYAHVEHILISLKPTSKPPRTDAEAKALAENILARVKKGANFAALAQKYSDDPGSAAHGGDLGKVSPGETVPPFNHAAFTAALNTPVLVHSQYGYHVIVVLARGTGPPQVSTQDQQNQRSRFLAWVKQQEKAAKIVRVARVK